MSCLMWQTTCSKTGACPVYDTDQLRIRLHVIYGLLHMFTFVTDIWVIYWAKGLKLVDEEEEHSKAEGNVTELEPLNKPNKLGLKPEHLDMLTNEEDLED
ncbi:hypothetical protein OESDEN_16470 [Oesophagostomum dentatum]|uniref:Uncharacterized protein n=1 Tax=Oesophagostomum dentatum TaxID=61180 RepID=A0A0B1SIW0_OESDE|nr:hypothetical protein OESDEN_16470 [Oesophagostomum dentatum]